MGNRAIVGVRRRVTINGKRRGEFVGHQTVRDIHRAAGWTLEARNRTLPKHKRPEEPMQAVSPAVQHQLIPSSLGTAADVPPVTPPAPSRYSAAKRQQEAILEVLVYEEAHGIHAASQRFKLSEETIACWKQEVGATPLRSAKTPPKALDIHRHRLTRAQVARIVEMELQGRPAKTIGDEMKISVVSVNRVRRGEHRLLTGADKRRLREYYRPKPKTNPKPTSQAMGPKAPSEPHPSARDMLLRATQKVDGERVAALESQVRQLKEALVEQLLENMELRKRLAGL